MKSLKKNSSLSSHALLIILNNSFTYYVYRYSGNMYYRGVFDVVSTKANALFSAKTHEERETFFCPTIRQRVQFPHSVPLP